MAKLDDYRECDRCNCIYEAIDVSYPNMTIILQRHRPIPGYYRFHELDLFKVKHKETNQIYQVLNVWFDEILHQTYFLIWDNNGWRWRPAHKFVPPNMEIKNE